MTKPNLGHPLLKVGAVVALVAGIIAADHVDSPSVAGTTADIADFYAFEGANASNTVFIVNMQGPLAPGTETENARFDEDILHEINIDNSGDFVEDLVIQAIRRGDSMYFNGPVPPNETGLSSTVTDADNFVAIPISSGGDVITATGTNGMMFYAGPRRDPFFFDLNRFNAIAGGTAAPDGFLPAAEADDFFDELNVLSIVVEVPNSMLGAAPAHVGGAVGLTGLPAAYNTWVSTKRKQ